MNIEFTGKTITIEDGGIMFQALVDGKSVVCVVTLEALQAHFRADSEQAVHLTPFQRGREKICVVAERMIQAGINPVFITSEDIQ